MQSLYGAIANTNKKEIMAVSVDKVYQKVLALANKEQRGYITPQEFNLFADHAQMDIFEQYFYDLEQRKRRPGIELNYADIANNIEEKIDSFKRDSISVGVDPSGVVVFSGLLDFYRLTLVTVDYSNTVGIVVAERVSHEEYFYNTKSPLAKPTHKFPIYKASMNESTQGTGKIQIFPEPTEAGEVVYINYIVKPKSPNWTYYIDPNTKNALYNSNAEDFQDFELHSSEETALVIKILQLAGVSIKDFNLTQVATQEEVKNIQQEKQ